VWLIHRLAGNGGSAECSHLSDNLYQRLIYQRLIFTQCERQEIKMSGVNGDKARFNRRRRQKISRRQSTQKMLKSLAEKNLVAPALQTSPKEKA
jgi:hypothetical protein